MVDLRDYQKEIIEKTRACFKQGSKRVCIVSPTGSGKTRLTSFMLKVSAAKGFTSCFIVHRDELIQQSKVEFLSQGISPGVIAAGYDFEPRKPVQIASINTLVRRLDKIERPNFVVFDECHHCAAASWDKVATAFKDSFHIGLTATPRRLDGRGLEKYFDTIVNGPTTGSLIDAGFLSKYKLFAPSQIDLTGIKTIMGDYDKQALAEAADKPSITGNAIDEYSKHCLGKSGIVFAVNIKHSTNIAEAFNERGIVARHIDGKTPRSIRREAMAQFKSGKIQILSNVGLFGEGVDVPALQAVIVLRPTKSLALYLQMVGRTLRPSPDKDHATILDHAGNWERHGLPDDEREWTLEGKKKKEKAPECPVKVCPNCFLCVPISTTICEHCGHAWHTKAREIEHGDGELEEVTRGRARATKLKEQWACQTEEELFLLGRRRGHKGARFWAKKIMESRFKKSRGA